MAAQCRNHWRQRHLVVEMVVPSPIRITRKIHPKRKIAQMFGTGVRLRYNHNSRASPGCANQSGLRIHLVALKRMECHKRKPIWRWRIPANRPWRGSCRPSSSSWRRPRPRPRCRAPTAGGRSGRCGRSTRSARPSRRKQFFFFSEVAAFKNAHF